MTEMKLEVFRQWDGKMTLFGIATFPEMNANVIQTVKNFQEQEGTYVRANWELTVALIDAGAFGKTWAEFREEVFQAVEDGEYGDLEEIGTSDVNHMIVGRVTGMKVIA